MKAASQSLFRCFSIAVCVFWVPLVLQAQLEPDGANDSNYVALGNQYVAQTVWVQGISIATGNHVGASGILLDPYDVIVAAHFAAGVSFTDVGSGPNQLISPGTTSAVLDNIVYPGYVNNGQFNSPDLAIVHLAAPIGTTNLHFGSIDPGDLVVITGFGFHGTPSGGISYDGELRGWTGPIDNSGLPRNVSVVYYDNVNWSNDSDLPGSVMGGSSGGGVYDDSGNLVGMIEAQYGGTGPDGGQQFLDFGNQGHSS